MNKHFSRRNFLNGGLTAAASLTFPTLFPQPATAQDVAPEESLFVVGPLKGYTPQIGTLVSMLNYNRDTIIRSVKNMTMAQLDFLFDANANTIGGLLLHLAAVDKFYQINTFEGRQDFNEEEKKEWGAAMELGDAGRKEIKGREVSYYLNKLAAVREQTLAELKKKNDKWLLAVDPVRTKQMKQSINTYWKWFHVCEHESNHRGQISWLKSRLPGAKPAKD
ncbi:putative damage-inducible protein DinB [Larkinella arboricola]|uniref:Putative damage-inducible protein DinB n=1 Tax=Larkinella arboricola TaxID=643671 RepID=A0A327X1A1_LARAB|nr:DinB family protein [Larkinella arboricola]RAJ98064.1 putative damage-inducible protein DinB [Larkinella arboricola]